MVVVVHVDDNLAHAKDQATMKRFATELGSKFNVKLMVETFGIEKASRTSAFSRVPTLSKADKPQTSDEKGGTVEIPYREAVEVLMWTAKITRPNIVCAVHAAPRLC